MNYPTNLVQYVYHKARMMKVNVVNILYVINSGVPVSSIGHDLIDLEIYSTGKK